MLRGFLVRIVMVKLLAQDCPDVTGGVFHIETDPVSAVEGMLSHIESKRKQIGI